MLAYYYALISNPCERTVKELLDYVRINPERLYTLENEIRGQCNALSPSLHSTPMMTMQQKLKRSCLSSTSGLFTRMSS